MPTYKDRKCHFCTEQVKYIDYKDVDMMNKFTTKYMKIIPRYYSGTCLKHQKRISKAIKNSRRMALIPFTV